MASYDNMMAMEQPWPFRSTFADSWMYDIFAKETETLTKALQKSFAGASSDGDVFQAETAVKHDATPIQTPTGSGWSEHDAPISKQSRSLPPKGRVTKRKSRVSKRSTTTFITADPANFRQMVQQVTGVRFGGPDGMLPAAPVLKPEPQRVVSRIHLGGGLPNFDMSAFVIDGPASSLVSQPPPPPLPSTVVDGGGSGSSGLDFDSFLHFPTLESWKDV